MAKNKKSLVDKILPHSYICGDCAGRLNGKWPEGHCATVHVSICPYCEKSDKVLACITDYRWPFWDTEMVREI